MKHYLAMNIVVTKTRKMSTKRYMILINNTYFLKENKFCYYNTIITKNDDDQHADKV